MSYDNEGFPKSNTAISQSTDYGINNNTKSSSIIKRTLLALAHRNLYSPLLTSSHSIHRALNETWHTNFIFIFISGRRNTGWWHGIEQTTPQLILSIHFDMLRYPQIERTATKVTGDSHSTIEPIEANKYAIQLTG